MRNLTHARLRVTLSLLKTYAPQPRRLVWAKWSNSGFALIAIYPGGLVPGFGLALRRHHFFAFGIKMNRPVLLV